MISVINLQVGCPYSVPYPSLCQPQLLLTRIEELVAVLTIQGSPACNSHEMLEVRVQRKAGG